MTDIWLPPSARGLGIEVTPLEADEYGQVLGPDSGVFLHAHDFGSMTVQRGELPCVSVEFKPLREAILNGVAEVERYGITQGLATNGGEVVPWPDDELSAYLQLKAYHVHVFVGKAPTDWLARALAEGFVVACLPAYDDGTMPYLATGPMTFHEMILPGSRRGEKVGRNEPCPCGSSLKFKRCCGGSS